MQFYNNPSLEWRDFYNYFNAPIDEQHIPIEVDNDSVITCPSSSSSECWENQSDCESDKTLYNKPDKVYEYSWNHSYARGKYLNKSKRNTHWWTSKLKRRKQLELAHMQLNNLTGNPYKEISDNNFILKLNKNYGSITGSKATLKSKKIKTDKQNISLTGKQKFKLDKKFVFI